MATMGKELVSADVLRKVCKLVEEGQTLTRAAELLKVDRDTIYGALKRYPEMVGELDRARVLGAHAMAEDVVNISDSGDDPKKVANRMKSRQWLASKRDPKTYGERLDLNVNQTVDVQGALNEARARVLRPVRDQHGGVVHVPVDESITNVIDATGCESIAPTDSTPTDPTKLDVFK